MNDILGFLGGLIFAGIGGACVGYLMGTKHVTHIQIGGDNSKQTMIGNINNYKCNTCSHSKFVEPEIAMKSLYCSKRGYLCDQIEQCSDYSESVLRFSEEESEKIFDEVWDEKDKESVDIYNAAD